MKDLFNFETTVKKRYPKSMKFYWKRKNAPSLTYTKVIKKLPKQKFNPELQWLYDLLGWNIDDKKPK